MVNCAVASEEPAGLGFGVAALTVVDKVKGTPPCTGSVALQPGGAVVPLRFIPALPTPPMRSAVFKKSSAYARYGPAGPYFPDRAAREGVTSVALVDCRVGEAGQLRECEVADVLRPEYGFGFAALKMAEQGWMVAGPAPEGAAPDDGIWRFQVEFGRRAKP